MYDGHDWKWFAVRLKHTDMEYLRKHWSGKKASAPTLEKKHDKYFLRFTYAEEVSLNRTPVKEQTICSVDLGINTDAVCTIMRQTELSWEESLLTFPVTKTGCTVRWDGSEDFSGNMDRVRRREDGHMQNV